jgi:flagellar basal body-associated protein FliL
MNALLIPILLICGLFLVAAFVVWMVFFSRSGKQALTEQDLRDHRNHRRPT